MPNTRRTLDGDHYLYDANGVFYLVDTEYDIFFNSKYYNKIKEKDLEEKGLINKDHYKYLGGVINENSILDKFYLLDEKICNISDSITNEYCNQGEFNTLKSRLYKKKP